MWKFLFKRKAGEALEAIAEWLKTRVKHIDQRVVFQFVIKTAHGLKPKK
jgi:hypothetical protein